MAGIVAGVVTRYFCGSSLNLHSKCINYCFPRYFTGRRQNEKPKKPASHFILYYKNIRSSIDEKNPGMKQIEKVKVASMMYKKLSPEENLKLKEQSEKLLKEYKEERERWQSSLSSVEKDAITAERQKKKEDKVKRKIRKLQVQNEMPKKAPSAFFLYSSDQLKAINVQFMSPKEKSEVLTKNVLDCSQRWKAMPQAEKEVYTKLAAERMEQYEAEMIEWEQNMIEEGKEELVRKKTLKEHQADVRRSEKKLAKEKQAVKTTVAKKSGVKTTKALTTPKKKSTPKKKVHFEESDKLSKKDFYSSDSE